jgi:hypothetical protein
MSPVSDATRAAKLEAVISSFDHYLQARDRLIGSYTPNTGDHCAPSPTSPG